MSEWLEKLRFILSSLALTEELISEIGMSLGLSVLIFFMLMSVIEMGKEGKADKTGWLVISLVLLAGVAGFAVKKLISVAIGV